MNGRFGVVMDALASVLRPGCALLLGCVLALSGCATTGGEAGEMLGKSPNPAWSLRQSPPHLVVAVSPVRQTLQIAGSIGTVIGAGVTAVQNAGYRNELEQALGEYDTVGLVDAGVADMLSRRLDGKAVRVTVLDRHAAEGRNPREAAQERYRQLAKAGHEQVLDISASHGIYGVYGDLVVRIRAELRSLPSGQVLWKETITAHGDEPAAWRSLADPTERMLPNITNPRLTSKDNAVSQWTENNGARFKAAFEGALHNCLAALDMRLGGPETADGLFALGSARVYDKKFAEAHAFLEKARRLAPERADIANVLAVNLAHHKQVDDAIAVEEALLGVADENGPAHMNLAWWYAMDKKEMDRSRSHYEKARSLGMEPIRRLERELGLL